MTRFWSYDGCTTDLHDTEAEAIRACERALDTFRDDADEGWDEATTQIMWGPIAQRVVEANRREHTCPRSNGVPDHGDSDCGVPEHVDYTCDMRLQPVVHGALTAQFHVDFTDDGSKQTVTLGPVPPEAEGTH